jgi:hypothetical protein
MNDKNKPIPYSEEWWKVVNEALDFLPEEIKGSMIIAFMTTVVQY